LGPQYRSQVWVWLPSHNCYYLPRVTSFERPSVVRSWKLPIVFTIPNTIMRRLLHGGTGLYVNRKVSLKNWKKTHTPATEKRGDWERCTHVTQSTGKQIDYIPIDRGCWGPFGERDSSKGEICTLADSSQSICSVKCAAKNRMSVCRQSFTIGVMDHGQHARAMFLS
jgi:hypothetical protein